MEFTESSEWRTMLEDFTLIQDDTIHRPLFQEMWYVLSAETERHGDSQGDECMVGMGNNLLPWQLGPLGLIRSQTIHGIRTTFGTACDLLLRRCVTVRRDFFYALLDIVKTGLTVPQLSTDEQEAMLQVARSCIKAGDYGPLFITPGSAQTKTADIQNMRSDGYLDLVSFAMGYETMPPTFHNVRFCSISGNLAMKAESIGPVQSIKQMKWSEHEPSESLSILLRFVLESNFLNVDAFANALGGRFYGQVPGKISDHLKVEDKTSQLQITLEIFTRRVQSIQMMT